MFLFFIIFVLGDKTYFQILEMLVVSFKGTTSVYINTTGVYCYTCVSCIIEWVDMVNFPENFFLRMGSGAAHKYQPLCLNKCFPKMHSCNSICIFVTFFCILAQRIFIDAFYFICFLLSILNHKSKGNCISNQMFKCKNTRYNCIFSTFSL